MGFLETVVAEKRQEVLRNRQSLPLKVLYQRIAEPTERGSLRAPRDFAGVLRGTDTHLIAELKARTPTIGHFAAARNLPSLAKVYDREGASAISIVVDERRFGTSLSLVETVREAVSLPILVKEFVIDPYQIFQARAAGADALLLMVRLLDEATLCDFLQLSHELQMTALVETHSASEIEAALRAGAQVIGVNNRDLDRLEVSLDTARRLLPLLPKSCLRVAESGIHSRKDVLDLAHHGADACLVGGALLAAGDPAAMVRTLLGIAGDQEDALP